MSKNLIKPVENEDFWGAQNPESRASLFFFLKEERRKKKEEEERRKKKNEEGFF